MLRKEADRGAALIDSFDFFMGAIPHVRGGLISSVILNNCIADTVATGYSEREKQSP